MSTTWDLKGRAATASIYPDQLQLIVRSQMWMQVTGRPLMWVLERAIEIERAGFFSGVAQLPELFACLVVRVLQIVPKPELVLSMVQQDVHKYLRLLAAVVIRLIGNKDMVAVALTCCLEDYRKIRVRQTDGSLTIIPLDVLCEQLFFPDVSNAGDAEPKATEKEEGEVAVAEVRHAWRWCGLRLTTRVL